MIRLICWVCFLALFAAPRASADDHLVHLSRTETISGVQVEFPADVIYSIPADVCTPIRLELRIALNDLNSKLTQIVKSTGVEKHESCGDSITINNARIWPTNGRLAAKVEGNVGRQECIKTKVPEFHGLEVTFKDRVVASTSIDSNASIEANFGLAVENNALRVSLIGEPQLNVSNDILRTLAQVFNLDDRIRLKLAEAIRAALLQPESALQLPSNLAGFEFKFDGARADTTDGSMNLIISGTSPRTQPLLTQLFTYLGGASGAAVAETPCP
jgi:hypothetical protein